MLHDVPVRTTLTLDDDVAARLRRAVRDTGIPMRTVANEALRSGLEARESRAIPPFRVDARVLGLRPGLSLDSISALLEQVEGPEHR